MSESQKNQLSQFIQSTHSDHFKAQFKDPSKKQAIADKVKTNPVEALNEFNLALENRTERVGDLKGDITYTKSSFNDYLKSLHADEGDTQSTTTPESTPIEKLMKDITVPAT